MDWLFLFITEHASYAHWILFSLLLLAGLSVPISEDLIVIIAGVLASTLIQSNALILFIFVFLGAYFSDWIAYTIGRLLGPTLWQLAWFKRAVKKERLQKLERYYERYGLTTLLIGRFIPFGIRNCLFWTAGMAKMPFIKFIIADGIACFLSNLSLFSLAYFFGRNYDRLMSYLEVFDIVAVIVAVMALTGFFGYRKIKKSRAL